MNEERRRPASHLREPAQLRGGSLRQLDPRITAQRPLSIFFYETGDTPGLELKTHWEKLLLLRELGLRTNPENELVEGVEAIKDKYRRLLGKRHELPYEIDGSVIKVDSEDQRRRLGRCPGPRAGPSPLCNRQRLFGEPFRGIKIPPFQREAGQRAQVIHGEEMVAESQPPGIPLAARAASAASARRPDSSQASARAPGTNTSRATSVSEGIARAATASRSTAS